MSDFSLLTALAPEAIVVVTALVVLGAGVARKPAEGLVRILSLGGGLAALDAHLETYRRNILAQDAAVEAATTPRQYFDVMKHVNPLHRSTRNLMAVMQEAREVRPEERRLINFRDRAAELERAIDLVANDAKSGMDFALAENTEEQSRFAHVANIEARRLNRIVSFFFPLATLVAVFGMSPPVEVVKMPGFWLVIIAGILAGLVIQVVPRKGN